MLGHPYSTSEKGDQKAGNLFEKIMLGKTVGRGKPDLQLYHYTPVVDGLQNYELGDSYEFKTTEYWHNKLHILRRKGDRRKLIYDSYKKMAKLIAIEWTEKDNGEIIFDEAHVYTNIKPFNYFLDHVKIRYSKTHNSWETYLKDFFTLKHLYKNEELINSRRAA